MWELDYKEGRVVNNWCFQTVVLEKSLESLLNSKEIKPVNPRGNQPWKFIGRTDAEAEAPIPWPLCVKNQIIGKNPNAGKDWRWEEKGMTEDEMVEWHHDSMDMNLSKLRELVIEREAWRAAVHGVSKSWIWLSDWTGLNEAEAVVFLEFCHFFYDPRYVGSLVSGSSAFSKSSLNIWKFSIQVNDDTSYYETK